MPIKGELDHLTNSHRIEMSSWYLRKISYLQLYQIFILDLQHFFSFCKRFSIIRPSRICMRYTKSSKEIKANVRPRDIYEIAFWNPKNVSTLHLCISIYSDRLYIFLKFFKRAWIFVDFLNFLFDQWQHMKLNA